MGATSFHSNARYLECPTCFILTQGQIHLPDERNLDLGTLTEIPIYNSPTGVEIACCQQEGGHGDEDEDDDDRQVSELSMSSRRVLLNCRTISAK